MKKPDPISTIWKYTLPREPGPCVLLVPRYAQAMAAAEQDGILFCWMVVDPVQPLVPKEFYVCFTGLDAPAGLAFLSTVVGSDSLVRHVFEKIDR